MGRSLWERVLDLLFPPKCTFCHELLAESELEDRICAQCLAELQPQQIQLSGEFLDGGYSLFSYEGKVRQSIHRFKFNGRKEYAPVYARLLSTEVRQAEWIEKIDVVTYVPTNCRNVRKRGYNHAALLAKYVAFNLRLDMIPMLEKTRETQGMYGLKPHERRANIMGAIKISCNTEQIAGKNVLLVDDIFTTGATAGECAGVLRMAGAAKVFVLTVAKTEKSY